jgi:hypothetical protein
MGDLPNTWRSRYFVVAGNGGVKSSLCRYACVLSRKESPFYTKGSYYSARVDSGVVHVKLDEMNDVFNPALLQNT